MSRRRAGPKERPSARPGRALRRHLLVALGASALTIGFWLSRLEWDPEMRTWRALGDASILLLFASLTIGPLARLWPVFARALPWRRELGVWFVVTGVAHALLILAGWVEWDVGRTLGYEFIPQLGRVARLEPGFGLANLLGLVAVLWAMLLGATSTDRAVDALGPGAWKWLHHGAYVLFYLVVLHTAYFLFIHFTPSFHRAPPPENWFRWPLLGLGAAVLLLQWTAFAGTVRRRKRVARQAPHVSHTA